MKSSLILHLAFQLMILCYSVLRAQAQVDPASALLVRPPTSASSATQLDSSRYTVKQSENKKNEARAEGVTSDEVSQTPYTSTTQQTKSTVPHTKPIPLPAAQQKLQPLTESASSEDAELIEIRKSELNFDQRDSRLNLVDLSLAPGFFYVDSSSAYWFRKYHSSGPGLSVGADIWVDTTWGFNLDYFTTLSASLNVDPATTKEVLVDHRFTQIGVQFRKYASKALLSPNILFGLAYSEYQMLAPTNEASRMRIKSAGPALSVYGYLPQSEYTKFIFGIELMPKLKVTESNSATNAESGTNPATYAIRLKLGQDFAVDAGNTLFWRLSYRLEQSVYKGQATANDPITGTKPEGVSVQQQMTLFEMGYSWGE